MGHTRGMRILVVCDPLAGLDLAGDTTYALMGEAARRGHEIWTCQPGHLGLEHDDPIAEAQVTTVREAETPADAFRVEERTPIPLEATDMVWIRQDPPVDVAFLHATWILERARGKTLLVNDPRGIRELNEHLAVLAFPDLTPPTIVTRSQARLQAFLQEQGGSIVVKPIDGYGGLGVFLARLGDPNLSSIFETATRQGEIWTMAQRYMPEVASGDKRILLAGGETIGAILRVPPEAETRSNLHVGGVAQATEITDNDQAIIRAVSPVLRAHGLIFAGLDVIGDRLTEINITSPTGIRQLSRLERRNAAADVLARLEDAAKTRARDGVG
jgi:glutathione synthase